VPAEAFARRAERASSENCAARGRGGSMEQPVGSLTQEQSLAFSVGDRVVYPHHGAAVIEKKEKVASSEGKKDYFVLRMTHGELTLKVPVDRAEEIGMRYPISVEDVEDVFEVLGKKDVREPTNWSRRFKNHQEKLKSGDVYQVAEVVRNLALRDAEKGLSAGEKSMFVRARQVLVSELAFSLNIDEDQALERLATALS
jgi:CarD family transcriptional regulator